MPIYDKSGLAPSPKLLNPGEPGYLFGSKSYNQSDTRFSVTNTALTSNVVTLTVQIVSGNIPVAGGLVSVRATTAGSGAVNAATAVPITTVTISASTGAGTIVFPLTASNIVSIADTGYGIIPVWELAETCANVTSAPIAVFHNESDTSVERTINVIASCPSLPTTASFMLQGAMRDADSEYTNLSTTPFATVTGGTLSSPASVQYSLENVNFVRCVVSSVTGGTPTMIVKVL